MTAMEKIFSTGQIATICGCAPRTVCQWIDRGELSGYRLPGSKDRRVTRESLLEFLQRHDMPIPKELGNRLPAEVFLEEVSSLKTLRNANKITDAEFIAKVENGVSTCTEAAA